MDMSYDPPLALTIISGIFLALGAVCAIGVAVDIVWRRGWQSMMGIMIPVYIINATYLGPFAVYIYYRFGRPVRVQHNMSPAIRDDKDAYGKEKDVESQRSSTIGSDTPETSTPQESTGGCCHSKGKAEVTAQAKSPGDADQSIAASYHSADRALDAAAVTKPSCHSTPGVADTQTEGAHQACHSSGRPFWATVTSGVFHCGAGCVLGDIVGEWLVYGTGVTINGHMIWPELLIDYAFALLFGIVFQYFSIAPMSGQWGPVTFWRAAKADIASLTSFEIGAFGWMIAFQVGMFNDNIGMDTWFYWWMMQVGMCIGVLTAWPANWWLLRHNVKEACC